MLAAQSTAAQASSVAAAAEMAKVAQELLRYRQQEQGLARARDWDLSRPDRLRTDSPARCLLEALELHWRHLQQAYSFRGDSCRVGDNDARCGPASLQKFAGEDLEYQQRKAEQEGDNRDIWHAQAECTIAARAADKAAHELQAEEVCLKRVLNSQAAR